MPGIRKKRGGSTRVVATLAVAAALSAIAGARGSFGATPRVTFTHGVAAGDVRYNSAVVWTRVDTPTYVTATVSTDSRLRVGNVVRNVRVTSATDFTAKALVTGLKPGARYYYRFTASGSTSDIGTFRTPPANTAASTPLRFAFASNTDGTRVAGQPYFNSFQTLNAIRAENPDFFVYLGNTVYADQRPGALPDAQTVDDYRSLYKANRTVLALPQLLKSTPTYAVWNAGEVRTGFNAETVSPNLFAAGRQAFLDYMPINTQDFPRDPQALAAPMFRIYHWGKDVDLFILDTRSARSRSVAAEAEGDLAPALPSQYRPLFAPFLPLTPPDGTAEALADPSRTFLGQTQKSLLLKALAVSKAKFKFIMGQGPVQQQYLNPYDSWEGYAAERSEILSFIRDNRVKNVVFISGGSDGALINTVCVDKFNDDRPVATEFVVGPTAHTTAAQQSINLFGEDLGPQWLAAQNSILDLAGVQARSLNSYSYGMVEVDPQTGNVSVSFKDASGTILPDDVDPNKYCFKTLHAN